MQYAEKQIDVGVFKVFQLKMGKHDAFLCCPATVGEIAATAACQILISQFKVDLILNFGVVGALTQNAAVLSTMYVKSVVHYDMDLCAIDGVPIGYYGCFDAIAVECDQSLLQKALQLENLPLVCCASADKFVGDAEQKLYLHKQFGADICDMESAAVLFCCKFNKIPCLIIKCVSDSILGNYGEYKQNAEKAAAGFFDFAKKLAATL